MSFTVVNEKRPRSRPKRPTPPIEVDGPVPAFEVISNVLDGERPTVPVRRNWKPVIDELMAGNLLFMSVDDLTDQNAKYLTLALSRRGERLRYHREVREGVTGRLVWVEPR